jgi:hypothetical protein
VPGDIVEPVVWEIIRILREVIFDYHKAIIEFVSLLFVWLLLKRERRRLQEAIGELTEGVDTLKEEFIADKQERQEETPAILAQVQAAVPLPISPNPEQPLQPSPQVMASVENWKQVSDIWSDTKARIQKRIATIKPAGTRKKYSKFSRYTYVDIINALLVDNKISGATRDKLLTMNQRFLSLRPRIANTTTDDVNLFRQLFDEVSIDLANGEKPVS